MAKNTILGTEDTLTSGPPKLQLYNTNLYIYLYVLSFMHIKFMIKHKQKSKHYGIKYNSPALLMDCFMTSLSLDFYIPIWRLLLNPNFCLHKLAHTSYI